MGGWRVLPNPKIAKEHADWYWNMGLTAEEVAKVYKVSREDQDVFMHILEQEIRRIWIATKNWTLAVC